MRHAGTVGPALPCTEFRFQVNAPLNIAEQLPDVV